MTNEIQKIESPLTAAAALVSADGNMDVAKLKELLDVQERWEANQAKKAYVVAMSEFKANPPKILKDKSVGYDTRQGGTVGYRHASLANVTTCINKALSEHGMTASWLTSQNNGSVKVICKITHILGHSEETSLSAPPDDSGKKNLIQQIGSTVTYLQRYTLLALTGLATYDQDDDGKGADKKLELPPLTGKNKDALSAIFKILKKSLPDDMTIDKDRVATLFLKHDAYPENASQADKAAVWLITNNKLESWTKPKPKAETPPDSDDQFDMHCKACKRNFAQADIVITDEGGVCPNCDSNNPDDICLQSEREGV